MKKKLDQMINYYLSLIFFTSFYLILFWYCFVIRVYGYIWVCIKCDQLNGEAEWWRRKEVMLGVLAKGIVDFIFIFKKGYFYGVSKPTEFIWRMISPFCSNLSDCSFTMCPRASTEVYCLFLFYILCLS